MDEPLKSAVGDLIAQAEASLTALERYRAGLEILGQGHILDAPAFARALLAGQEPAAAWGADVAEIERPRSADEQAAFAQGLHRVELRREIVRAALTLETEHQATLESGIYRNWHAAEQQLYALARQFRAAGGDEVMG